MKNIPENYVRITQLSQMQDMLRELMYEFHCLCEKHGLMYNIWGGTLLGAVRHQDMIPWDDDIDVSMPRADYEKLIEIVNTEYADRFEVCAYPKENYIYPFGKFCKKNTILIEGVLKPQYGRGMLYVDIFPLDGIPSLDEQELRKRYRRVIRDYRFTSFCVAATDSIPQKTWKRRLRFLKPVLSVIFNIWGYRYFLEKQIAETKRYRFEDCEYIAFVSHWGGKKKGIMKKSDYLKRKLYKLGDYAFWGQENAHEWLTNWYGDYMTPPPEDKRCAVHNYELYVEVEK